MSKRVGIATFYKSVNCGSFLQAYSLKKAVEELGHEVAFVKYPTDTVNKPWYKFLQAGKQFLLGRTSTGKHLLKVYSNLKKAHKKLPEVKKQKDLSAIIYGSDTIWDIDDMPSVKTRRVFFGTEYNGRKIAYAASVGATAKERLLKNEELCESLKAFSALSVRDKATMDFVKNCCGENRSVEIVIDPTMLIEREKYWRTTPDTEEKGYILFYFFGKIGDSVKEQVKTFADKTGRKIIIMGDYRGWEDKNISNDPFLMLSYYKNADYIITNTFHGNVFSLIFNKQFVSFGSEKQKVRSLLAQFGLEDRLQANDADFIHLFDEKIDFTQVNGKMDALRQQSLEYLKKALEQEVHN